MHAVLAVPCLALGRQAALRADGTAAFGTLVEPVKQPLEEAGITNADFRRFSSIEPTRATEGSRDRMMTAS